jgi:hypothetical protein
MLWIKKQDEFATKKDVSLFDRSIKTGRSLEEIALGKNPKGNPKLYQKRTVYTNGFKSWEFGKEAAQIFESRTSDHC